MGPERGADNSAVLVVPNVKARTEAQHSIFLLSLHDLLRGSFYFFTYSNSIQFNSVIYR